MTIDQLSAHIEALGKAFQIQLLFEVAGQKVSAEAAMAVDVEMMAQNLITGEIRPVKVRGIAVAPITNHATYAIALHELGHHLHPLGIMQTSDQDEFDRLEVLRERSAWEWAEANALEWNNEMEHVKLHGLRSYEQKAQRLGIDIYIRASQRIKTERALKARSDPDALRRFAKKILS
jgi:hypothetical protein